MGDGTIVIRDLAAGDERELLAAIAAMRASDPDFDFTLGFAPDAGFAAYLRALDGHRRGVGLPDGWVPSTMRFAFIDGRIAGRVSIRHRLNDYLARVGGHVGYGTVPGFRRRGVASALLRDALTIGRGLGIERMLVTCDDDNAGSIAVIVAAGGSFEDIVALPDATPKRRYWLATSTP
ncbi:MAG TPA: GNAT family N-acetyltransferase [Planctomycetota bacterium]|nr:GNAT family N-acetyltransferase [Planctomycetota bacterium]